MDNMGFATAYAGLTIPSSGETPIDPIKAFIRLYVNSPGRTLLYNRTVVWGAFFAPSLRLADYAFESVNGQELRLGVTGI